MFAEQSYISADYNQEALGAFLPDITAKEEPVVSPFDPNISAKEEPVEIIDESTPRIGRPSLQDDLDRMSKEHEQYLASLRAVANAETDHVRLILL